MSIRRKTQQFAEIARELVEFANELCTVPTPVAVSRKWRLPNAQLLARGSFPRRRNVLRRFHHGARIGMNSQQKADLLLAQWQSLRSLPPDERIERLFLDFFAPLDMTDVEFEAVLREVGAAMREDTQ